MSYPYILIPLTVLLILILVMVIIRQINREAELFNWFIHVYAKGIEDNYTVNNKIVKGWKKIPINEYSYLVIDTEAKSEYPDITKYEIHFYFNNERVSTASVSSFFSTSLLTNLCKIDTTLTSFEEPYHKDIEAKMKEIYNTTVAEMNENKISNRNELKLKKQRQKEEYLKIKNNK